MPVPDLADLRPQREQQLRPQQHRLHGVIHVTPSGCPHPYYTVLNPPLTSAAAAMHLNLCIYPPLGQETVLASTSDRVVFTVLVECSAGRDFEVEVWNDAAEGEEWTGLGLGLKSAGGDGGHFEVVAAGTHASAVFERRWYTGELARPKGMQREVSFTLRLRDRNESLRQQGGSDGWMWAQSQKSSNRDGKIIFQASSFPSASLEHYIRGLDSAVVVKKTLSDVSDTLLYSLTADVVPAKGEKSGVSTYSLGLPVEFVRWFSLVRLWSPWLAPRQGKGLPLAEKDAIVYSFLRGDGLHVALLAISGVDDVLTIFKYENEGIAISATNDRETTGVVRVLAAVGKTFEDALCAVVYGARKLVTEYTAQIPELKGLIAATQRSEKDVQAQWVQEWYDGFTYCTWNGLGQQLTEDKIMAALKSLEENSIHVTNLIVDDNWQSLDHQGQNQFQRGWTDFEANKEGFSKGLKSLTQRIRHEHPRISHIAVWHALLGYWGAISPQGKIAKNYQTATVKKRPGVSGGEFLVVDAPSVTKMYDDFYSFLATSGIDAVKTDAQFMIDELESAPARRALTSTYLNAWIIAQLRHHAGRAISCMSQTPPILFLCQLPTNVPTLPVRNSDDFFPDIEDSHAWHIFCNAHNSLLTSHLNVLPDWDMFQTDHKWAGFHAAARCLSGGPIYITDEPGKHDIKLIRQMTAKTCLDQTVILRPNVVGKATQPYIGFEEQRLCKIGTYNGMAATGTSYLGFFNCTTTAITELVPLDEFPGTTNKDGYILKNHRTGTVSKVLYNSSAESVIAVDVGGHDWEILSANPVNAVQMGATGKIARFANLGLLEQMTGGVAVRGSEVQVKPGSRISIGTSLKALGVLGVWIEWLDNIEVDQMMVLIQNHPIPVECVKKSRNSTVLEIDLEQAWKQMGLRPGWANEVLVEILVPFSTT